MTTRPSSTVGRAFTRAALRLVALFSVVFYGADFLAARRGELWALHFDWELLIPYWPAAYPVYLSVLALPFLVLHFAPSADFVRQWEREMLQAILIAGAMFVAVPAQTGYAIVDAGSWAEWSRFTRFVAGTYNLMPSLHVALGLITLLAVWPLVGRTVRRTLTVWFVLLVASVFVTHQHHVLDVLAGAALAVLLHRSGGWRLRATSRVP